MAGREGDLECKLKLSTKLPDYGGKNLTGSWWMNQRHKRLDAPRSNLPEHTEKGHFSGQEHRYGAGLRPSGVKISRWNDRKDGQRKNAGIVDGGRTAQDNCECIGVVFMYAFRIWEAIPFS